MKIDLIEVACAVVVSTGHDSSHPGGQSVLLRWRGHYPPVLEFPGGKVNAGESVVDAAIREALEETGVVVEAASNEPVFYTSPTKLTMWSDPFRLHFVECRLARPEGVFNPERTSTKDAFWRYLPGCTNLKKFMNGENSIVFTHVSDATLIRKTNIPKITPESPRKDY